MEGAKVTFQRGRRKAIPQEALWEKEMWPEEVHGGDATIVRKLCISLRHILPALVPQYHLLQSVCHVLANNNNNSKRGMTF